MWEQLLNNFIYIGIVALLFIGVYLSNMAFSLWYNIKILNQEFDKDKIKSSILKIIMFVLGLTLLCIVITELPYFVDKMGLTIPDEYSEMLTFIAIIITFLKAVYRYAIESYNKFNAILNDAKTDISVIENMIKTETTV